MEIMPHITALKARAVRAPLPRPVTTATMVIPDAPLVLIDVETDAGITGRAYLFGYTPLALRPLVAILEELAAVIIGKGIAPLACLAAFSAQFRLLGKQGLLGMAISGIDMALWDALGKAANAPVAALLGGNTTPIPAYYSHGVFDLQRDKKDIEAVVEKGFTAVKIKIGGGDIARDRKMICEVRSIIGENIRLMADYNQALSVPDALHRSRALQDLGLYWLEEPVLAEDLAGHARVRLGGGVPVQTGENWWFPEDAARAIAAGASDFAMLDIMKIGGVSGWLRAAAQAEGAGLPLSSHIFVEASAHALAATAGAHYLEWLDLAGGILTEPYMLENGAVRPRGPGLGMDWDEAAVSRHLV